MPKKQQVEAQQRSYVCRKQQSEENKATQAQRSQDDAVFVLWMTDREL